MASLFDGSACLLEQTWLQEQAEVIKEAPRIGIIGAHGTGKTTLADTMSLVMSIPRIDEVARTIHRNGFPLDLHADIRAEALMWLGQLHEELRLNKFVADRSLLDPIVYATVLADKLEWSEQDRVFINALKNISYILFRQHYTHIIYVPIEFELVGDGVRNEDISYQHEIDQAFRQLMVDFKIKCFIATGPVYERAIDSIKYCLS